MSALLDRLGDWQRQYDQLRGDTSAGALRTKLVILELCAEACGGPDPDEAARLAGLRNLLDRIYPEDL